MASLSLLVLRSHKLNQLKSFYEALGLIFAEERHESGPLHFSTQLGNGVVLELYPLKEGALSESSNRLGFILPDVDSTVAELKRLGHSIVKAAQQTEWGYVAVVKDPDGRAVELQS